MYRVFQELLNNILKHAQTTKVDLQLINNTSSLTIMLEDNGVGFDYNQIMNSNKGIGINNIITRLSFINGEICFDTQKNMGTTINIEIELKEKNHG